MSTHASRKWARLGVLILALVSIRSVEAADTGLKTGSVVSAGATWGGTFTTVNLNASDDAYAINTTGTGSADAGVLSTFGFGIPAGVAISDIALRQPELIFAARTPRSRAQLEATVDAKEHGGAWSIPATRAEIERALQTAGEFTPVAIATMTLFTGCDLPRRI